MSKHSEEWKKRRDELLRRMRRVVNRDHAERVWMVRIQPKDRKTGRDKL